MESTLNFVSIIIIIFGILQIILFFKMWGMTSDVRKIKHALQGSNCPNNMDSAKIELLIGNKEKAEEMFRKEFIVDVYKLYLKTIASQASNEYVSRFNNIENRYRGRVHNASLFIDFGQYSTFDKAKKIFD